MNKLMSSLIAATIVGAFSMSAIAAEKPAAAPKNAQSAKKHTVKAEGKKSDAAAMPAEPAKK